MLTIEKDLLDTETSIGNLQRSTMNRWLKQNPKINDLYESLISEPITFRGPHAPKGYMKAGGRNATPVKSQIIAILQALGKCKFEKSRTQGECSRLLVSDGVSVSVMGMGKIFQKYLDYFGLEADDSRVARVSTVKDAEELLKKERKRVAKKAAKAKDKDEVKEILEKEGYVKKETKAPAESPSKPKTHAEMPEDNSQYKDREIIYEPTPKQIEFHQAAETVVLYGGAAG